LRAWSRWTWWGRSRFVFENRRSNLDAVVLPGEAEPLWGAIPMQDMDALVDPHGHRLIVNPDQSDSGWRDAEMTAKLVFA